MEDFSWSDRGIWPSCPHCNVTRTRIRASAWAKRVGKMRVRAQQVLGPNNKKIMKAESILHLSQKRRYSIITSLPMFISSQRFVHGGRNIPRSDGIVMPASHGRQMLFLTVSRTTTSKPKTLNTLVCGAMFAGSGAAGAALVPSPPLHKQTSQVAQTSLVRTSLLLARPPCSGRHSVLTTPSGLLGFRTEQEALVVERLCLFVDLRVVSHQVLPRTFYPELLCASPAMRNQGRQEVVSSSRDAGPLCPKRCRSSAQASLHLRRQTEALKLAMHTMSSG